MIEPCQDYNLHSNWLQHNFPKIKTSTRNYLVYLVLKVRTFEDVGRCLSMPPNEWRNKLGGYLHEMYLEAIIEPVYIWHSTFVIDEAVSYALYLEHELEFTPSIEEVFKSLVNTKGGQIGYERAPSKYTKESPIVMQGHVSLNPTSKSSSQSKHNSIPADSKS